MNDRAWMVHKITRIYKNKLLVVYGGPLWEYSDTHYYAKISPNWTHAPLGPFDTAEEAQTAIEKYVDGGGE